MSLLAVMIAVGNISLAQRSQADVMQFLEVPQLSRLVASGGQHAVSPAKTAANIFHNPGFLTDSIGGSVDLGITPVGDGIKYASGAYAHEIEGIGMVAAGLVYAGYGDFVRTDERGEEMGEFTANEVALYLTYSRRMTPWLILGGTLKPMMSKMDDETAIGIAMDLGARGSFCDDRLLAGLTIKNAGGIIKKYSGDSNRGKIPFDVKASVCYKAENAPFRFLLTLKDLAHWDLRTGREKLNAGDNLMRHLIWGLEFTPVKAFYVAFGYDQRKRRELTSTQVGGMAGISWGVGLKISNIEVQYAHNRYHIAGSLNSITLSTNWRRIAGR